MVGARGESEIAVGSGLERNAIGLQSGTDDGPVLLLRESEIDRLLSIGAAVDLVTLAFRFLAEGTALNYPRQRGGREGAIINVMWAVAPAVHLMGLKSYPVVRTDVPQSSTSILLLYDLPDGRLRAVIEADRLGQRRTGAASAVATRHLARPDSSTMAVFGAGWQAQAQVEAIASVLPNLQEVLVVNRGRAQAEAFISQMTTRTPLRLRSAGAEEAVRSAHVIVTATGAREPLFAGEWIAPGTHVNAIGSNYPDRRELDATTLEAASLVVADARDVAELESGDLIVNGFDCSRLVELGDVIIGRSPGRTSDEQVTLFESQGLAVEDLICGGYAVQEAKRMGLGTPLPI